MDDLLCLTGTAIMLSASQLRVFVGHRFQKVRTGAVEHAHNRVERFGRRPGHCGRRGAVSDRLKRDLRGGIR
jgi:hypothetical protein